MPRSKLEPLPPQQLVGLVVQHYLASRDFNGVRLDVLQKESRTGRASLIKLIEDLINEGSVSIVTDQLDVNPHVKRFRHRRELQLQSLRDKNVTTVCVYPERSAILQFGDTSQYDNAPFSQALALGSPSLNPVAFQLDIIEKYKNDPRYVFSFSDYGGHVSITDRHHDRLRPQDRVYFRCGLAYAHDGRHLVAMIIWDLHKLPPQQQRILSGQMIDEPFVLEEDYVRGALLGEWVPRASYLSAFLLEQIEVNRALSIIAGKSLFNVTYPDQRPRELTIFIRPTRAEYESFTHALDKLISDNIDNSIFEGVELFSYHQTDRGDRVRQMKGSMQLLKEWLVSKYPSSRSEVDAIIQAFRGVRKKRGQRAHTIAQDEYDLKYYEQAEEVAKSSYQAMHGLRNLLVANLPANAYETPWWDGKIELKTYAKPSSSTPHPE